MNTDSQWGKHEACFARPNQEWLAVSHNTSVTSGEWIQCSKPIARESEFTDRSNAVLLLWIFYVFVLSCVCYVLCASVYMCFVVTCWERADLLALVCGVFCEFVTFPLVSWVRCGT